MGWNRFVIESGSDTASATSFSTTFTFDLSFNLSGLRPDEPIERAEFSFLVRPVKESVVALSLESGDDLDLDVEAASSSAAVAEVTAHRLLRGHSAQFARRRVSCRARAHWHSLDVGGELARWLAARNASSPADLFRLQLRVTTAAGADHCDWWRSMRPSDGKAAPTLLVYTSSEQQRSAAASRRRRAPNGTHSNLLWRTIRFMSCGFLIFKNLFFVHLIFHAHSKTVEQNVVAWSGNR